MRWLFFAYLAAVVYAYAFALPIPLRDDLPLSTDLAVRSGYLARAPASQLNDFDLSSKTVLVVDPGGAETHGLMHFDAHGLIVQADGDGGDTAQRTGMLFYRYRDAQAFSRALDQLEIAPGIFVRHPYQGGFRNDPNRFSRDQQRALVIALGSYGMTDRLWRMALAHLKRFGKYQNLDYLGPSHLGEYVRAFRAWPLYPILAITDIGLVASSVDIAIRFRNSPDEVDDNNHVMALVQAGETMPTPVSWLAKVIYKNYRPENFGVTLLKEKDPAFGALAWYHRRESGGNPFIAELYRDSL